MRLVIFLEVVEDQHVGPLALGQVDRAIGLLHGVPGLVVLHQACLAAPGSVVGVGEAVIPGHRQGVEGHLEVPGQVEISLGEGAVVAGLARREVEGMDLHPLGVGVAQAAITRGTDADRGLHRAQPHAGNGRPLHALTVDGDHVLQIRLLGRQHVEVLDPVDAMGGQGQAVVLGAFMAAVEEVLLAGEAHLEVVLPPGIAGDQVAPGLVFPGRRQGQGVEVLLVGPIHGLAIAPDLGVLGPGQQVLGGHADRRRPFGLGIDQEVVTGEGRLVQEVQDPVLGVQAVHHPDNVEG